jgi:hypothetical protein
MTLPRPPLAPLLPRISSGVLVVAVGEARDEPKHASKRPGSAARSWAQGYISAARTNVADELQADENQAVVGHGVVLDARADHSDRTGPVSDALLPRGDLKGNSR